MTLWTLAQQGTFLLPPSASNLATGVDWDWNVILGISCFFFCMVVFIMLFFVIKYRQRSVHDQTPVITHNTPLEIAWTLIPFFVLMFIFYIGFKGFINYDTPASNAVIVDVEAHKWAFQFTYPNGGISDALYVQQGVPVVLQLHSTDVLHALYIPAFRTQRNLIPSRQTHIWFIPEVLSPKEGYPIFCTQYCGEGHSTMHTVVHVLAKTEFDQAMVAVANPFKTKDAKGNERWVPYVQLGEKFYNQMGCVSCHSINGAAGTGPTWKGLWKSDVNFSYSDIPGFALKPTDPDSKWIAYVEQSVAHPEAKIVRNFANVMPSFETQFNGTVSKTEKLRAIMAFMKSIGTTGWKPPYPADSDMYSVKLHPKYHPESLAAEKAAATQNK